MCWLPIDQPLLRPGDSSCSARGPPPCSAAQVLAWRLRSVGDQLEKSWTAGVRADGGGGASARRHLKGFLRLAVHLTVLVLLGARRHL